MSRDGRLHAVPYLRRGVKTLCVGIVLTIFSLVPTPLLAWASNPSLEARLIEARLNSFERSIYEAWNQMASTDATLDPATDRYRSDLAYLASLRTRAAAVEASSRIRIESRVLDLHALMRSVPRPTGDPWGATPALRGFGGGIAGRVTDRAEDAIAEIRIEIWSTNGGFVGSTTTGTSGQYLFGGLDDGTYNAIAAPFTDFTTQLFEALPCPNGIFVGCQPGDGTPIEIVNGQIAVDIDFTLDPASEINGRLTDGTDAPISGYLVYARSGGFVVSAVGTDSDGVYRMSNLDAATFFIQTDGSEFLDEVWDDIPCERCDPTIGTPIDLGVDEVRSGIDFILARRGSIEGQLSRMRDGDPLRFDRVELWSASGIFVTSTSTDGNGDYTFAGLDAGTFFVSTDVFTFNLVDALYDDIACPGGAPIGCSPTDGTPVVVADDAVTAGIDLTLLDQGSVEGRLEDQNTGLAVPFERIRLYRSDGVFLTSTFSGDDGRFRLIGIPEGDYLAVAGSDAYRQALYDGVPCPGGLGVGCSVDDGVHFAVENGVTTRDIDFTLDRLGSIRGTLTERGTGLPAASVRVFAYDTDGRQVAGTNADALGDYLLDGLNPGTHFVATLDTNGFLGALYEGFACPTASGQGCDPTLGTAIAVDFGLEIEDIDLVLDRGTVISGRVREAINGAPIRFLNVELWSASGSRIQTNRTDDAGQFAFPNLAPGNYYAVTNATGFYQNQAYDARPCPGGGGSSCAPVAIGTPITVQAGDPTITEIDFDLDRLSILAGSVESVVGGLGLIQAQVSRFDDAGFFVDRAFTDSAGTYSFRDVPVGTYFLAASADGHTPALYDGLACDAGCDPTAGTPVVVPALNTFVGDLDFSLDRLGALQGTVRSADSGTPIENVSLRIVDPVGNLVDVVETDATGTFTRDNLAAGTYVVIAQRAGFLTTLFDGVLCPGDASTCPLGAASPIEVVGNQPTDAIDIDLVARSALLFFDGFESGNTSAWSEP